LQAARFGALRLPGIQRVRLAAAWIVAGQAPVLFAR
jgi:hypothetical protein